MILMGTVSQQLDEFTVQSHWHEMARAVAECRSTASSNDSFREFVGRDFVGDCFDLRVGQDSPIRSSIRLWFSHVGYSVGSGR